MKMLAVLGLLFLVSCHQNDNPAPAATAFTCQIDGVSFSPKSPLTFHLTPGGSGAGGGPYDRLEIMAPNTRTSAGIDVLYQKPPGTGDANYKLSGIYYDDSTIHKTYSVNLIGAVHQTSSGAWSGTFAGTGTTYTGGTTAPSTLSQGVFTEIKP